MIQLATVAALTAVAGGVLAILVRDSRAVAAGLLLMLVAASLTSSSTPQALIVALRVIGGLLAAYLILMAARSRSISSEGSTIGPVAEIGIAAAFFGVGWWASPVTPLPGSLAAQAAGIALIGIAVVPLLGRDVFRVGVAGATLVVGISLLLDAWTGTGPVLQQLLITLLFVCIAGAASLLLSPTPARRFAQAVAAGPAETGDFPIDSPAEEKPAQTTDPARMRPSPRAERHQLRGPRA